MKTKLAIIILVSLMLVSCVSETPPQEVSTQTATFIPPTSTQTPLPTSTPTATPLPREFLPQLTDADIAKGITEESFISMTQSRFESYIDYLLTNPYNINIEGAEDIKFIPQVLSGDTYQILILGTKSENIFSVIS